MDRIDTTRHIVLGTGPLARATAEALVAKGQRVTLISRSGRMAQPIAGTEVLKADIKDRAAMKVGLAGAQTIYFCAQPPYHRWAAEFPSLQAAAIDAAEEAGARIVVAENLYGYGPVDGPMREDMRLRPNTKKGTVRARMHEALIEAEARGRIRASVARGSDFFGPFVEGSVLGRRAIEAVFSGRSVEVVGDPDQPHAYSYVRDFGRAMALLGTDRRVDGGVWHVPNAPAITTRRVLEIAAHLAGQSLRLRRMGTMEMRVIGLFVPAVRETIEMLYEFERPFLVDDGKFKAMFGDLSTPIEAALAQTLAWYRAGRGQA